MNIGGLAMEQNDLYFRLREISSYCVTRGKELGLTEEQISELVRGVMRIAVRNSFKGE